MRTLSIDIETYSPVNLNTAGVYKYVDSPDFEILLFAYRYDNEPVIITDLTDCPIIPPSVVADLLNPAVIKKAHNATFERLCISAHIGHDIPPEQWSCTMVKSAMCGYPMALDAVCKAMRLADKKDIEGKALIRYFCIPCKPTKTNGGRTRNLPQHDPVKWEKFKRYCAQDVVTECAVADRLKDYVIPEKEKRLYALDQRINDRGIKLNRDLATNAIRINALYVENLKKEAIALTGLDNPNSVKQLLVWLNTEMPLFPITKLRKTDIDDVIKLAQGHKDKKQIVRLLNIRQEMSKTSVKKYKAMLTCLGTDGRVRGLLQIYGAGRTWRWAGRLIQVQNLPKNDTDKYPDATLDLARELVISGDGEGLQMCFGNVPDILSQLIRTAFEGHPKGGLVISDFSAIEARVIAWLAGEQWRLDVFNTHGKIYEASASKMFHVPIEEVTKGSVLRQKGKMAELALGYQGGPAAIIEIEISNRTPEDKRIPVADLPDIVRAWRKANKRIVQFWYDVQDAAIRAVQGGPATIQHGIKFYTDTRKTVLYVRLPSGRCLAYVEPRIFTNRFGRGALSYIGMNQTTKQWERQETYGGKIVENIVQAVARDMLAEGLLAAEASGMPIVLHVHDEIAADGLETDLKQLHDIMNSPISWAPGFPVEAESYYSRYYKKKQD